ncbi:MAG: dynamin family protein [Polyangiaceae bacterium]|nr:dynamin family protein [Polyangiaceae bacterium]
MVRLSDALSDWLSRAEVVARGADGRLRAGRRALGEGRASEARSIGLDLLAELPDSPVVLLLCIDAALAMQLDRDALDALEHLSVLLPFRADVWLRRAEVERRLGVDVGQSLERAADALAPTEAADRARLQLAERDLERGDPERAERWLAQLGVAAAQQEFARAIRVRTRLELGDREGAMRLASQLSLPAAGDGPGWLLRARLLGAEHPGHAEALRRALLLDAPGADAVLLDSIESLPVPEVEKLARLMVDLGRGDDPHWSTALALASDPNAGMLALCRAAASHEDPLLLAALVRRALQRQDPAALAQAARLAAQRGVSIDPEALAIARSLEASPPHEQLATLDGCTSPFAHQRRVAIVTSWLSGADAELAALLDELFAVASALGAMETVTEIGGLALELQRPLRAAIVGEFNAGKSSLINALLGEAVAPMGVLPTTATLHRLVWSPDRIARIERRDGQADRLVPFSELERTLDEVTAEQVERVTLSAPLELLKRVELVDTPGFNAPEAAHARAAQQAIAEAHVAVWLLDATQPLKASERDRLTELGALGLPLLVLVNKRDRLDGPALDEAVAHVERGLAAAGLTLERPLLSLSARQALSPDPAVRAGSGLNDVCRLVDELAGRWGDEVRRRALRQRVGRLVGRLGARAQLARQEQQRRLEERREMARALARWAEGRRDSRRVEGWRQAVVALLPELEAAARPVAGLAHDASVERFLSRRAARLLCAGVLDSFVADLVGPAREHARSLGEAPVIAALTALGPLLVGEGRGRAVERLLLVLEELAESCAALGAPEGAQAPSWELRLTAISDAFAGAQSARMEPAPPASKC